MLLLLLQSLTKGSSVDFDLTLVMKNVGFFVTLNGFSSA